MVDVGYERGAAVEPETSVNALKERLADPVAYFLGERGDKVVYPGPTAKHYGFPPSKSYVFAHPPPPLFPVSTSGFDPMLSFARGGLAEAWTGGCYEFSESDLRDFPFSSRDLSPYYAEVATRIGIAGQRDDIDHFSPFTAPYLDPLPLDAHSQRILDSYTGVRERLNRDLRFFLGRSRVATLTRALGDRHACTGLGRCLWGCPRESLYAPSATLRELLRSPRFAYLPRHLVRHFHYDTHGVVRHVTAQALDGGSRELEADLIVLAAGTLGSSRIYLESIYKREGRLLALGGLMDNQHAIIPFVNTRHVGQAVRSDSYQFHLLALGIEGADGSHESHGQITSLRAASVHPILQSIPFDMRRSLNVFRRLRSALGVVNVWRGASRRDGNLVTLRANGAGLTTLHIECRSDPPMDAKIDAVIAVVRRALGALGCVAPRRMAQVLPLGSSVHYAGTLPMSSVEREHTCDAHGRVRGFQNLIIADGAAFPSLPAKNLTFTLMANAARLADALPGAA